MTNIKAALAKKLWPHVVSLLNLYLALGVPANAQQCPSAPLCREVAPAGALLHNPNSNGTRVWTTACGPNTTKPRLDQICQQISSCPAAGGFGKFLEAVTFRCQSKQFDGYFGLDGMTFGILDWTSDNLPPVLQAYRQRGKDSFDETFGKLKLPMEGDCLDPKWVCDHNKQGKLMCDAAFHDAFSSALGTAQFQQAQADHALKVYEDRIKRFAHLGLKTEYGNTAMAVVANNLLRNDACRPETWMKACAGQADETKLVDCMLDRYVKNSCRGSSRGSQERANAIKEVFRGAMPSENIHPTAEAVISCSTSWGTLSK